MHAAGVPLGEQESYKLYIKSISYLGTLFPKPHAPKNVLQEKDIQPQTRGTFRFCKVPNSLLFQEHIL